MCSKACASDIAFCYSSRKDAFVLYNENFVSKAAAFDCKDGYVDDDSCLYKSTYQLLAVTLLWRHTVGVVEEHKQSRCIQYLTALVLDASTAGLSQALGTKLNVKFHNIVAVTRQQTSALSIRDSNRNLNVICGQLDDVWACYDEICDDDALPTSFSLIADDRMGHFSRQQEAHLQHYVAPRLRDRSIYTVTTMCGRTPMTRDELILKVCSALRFGGNLCVNYVVEFSYSRIYAETRSRGAKMMSLFFILERCDSEVSFRIGLPPLYVIDPTDVIQTHGGEFDTDNVLIEIESVLDGYPHRHVDSVKQAAERRLLAICTSVRKWIGALQTKHVNNGQSIENLFVNCRVTLADVKLSGICKQHLEQVDSLSDNVAKGDLFIAIKRTAVHRFLGEGCNSTLDFCFDDVCSEIPFDGPTQCYAFF